MKKSIKQLLHVAPLLWLLAQLAGCATASQPAAMMAGKVEIANRSAASVSVSVGGGKETNSMGASQISDTDFQAALSQSLQASGLFGSVVQPKAGRYHLDASIAKLSQPLFGFSFTVKMEVNYKLINLASGQVIWQAPVTSEHTATASDAFAGTTRLRLANEGAARRNIETAISEMGKLVLP